MTVARKEVVFEDESGMYHCIVRCVRRAFLCGEDHYSGKNYDHRKEWIRSRLAKLSEAFSVDVLAYSVMSNHLHAVLRTRPETTELWSDEEVARRWLSVYTPKHGGVMGTPVEYVVTEGDINEIIWNPGRVRVLRKRLGSLSWFMKALNEHIARRANKEDECKGRFWESRFKCQRLLDEAGILACMCYVDLNPVRACIAESLEDSEFTSAYDRIMARKALKREKVLDKNKEQLAPEVIAQERKVIRFSLDRVKMLQSLDGADAPSRYWGEDEYLKILDWTGRQIRKDKPGVISEDIRPLLESLELDAGEWVETVRKYRKRFGLMAGTVEHIREAAERTGKAWLKGCRSCEAAFRKRKLPTLAPA